MNLTPRQLDVLRLIRDHRITHGYSPTMQELAEHLGISKVTVFEHIEALLRKGALLREPNKARSLSIVDNSALRDEGSPLTFPLVGRIAAGQPVEHVEQQDELDLESVFGPRIGQRGQTFALQVKRDSMCDEGILEGDYVLVEQRSTARSGDRVVALLPDGETTLKTFHPLDNGHIRLKPANPEYDPIDLPAEKIQLQGVVLGVLRRY